MTIKYALVLVAALVAAYLAWMLVMRTGGY